MRAPQTLAVMAGRSAGCPVVPVLTRVHVQVAEAAGAQKPLRQLVLGLSTSMKASAGCRAFRI
jgi:hypothetical protein